MHQCTRREMSVRMRESVKEGSGVAARPSFIYFPHCGREQKEDNGRGKIPWVAWRPTISNYLSSTSYCPCFALGCTLYSSSARSNGVLK